VFGVLLGIFSKERNISEASFGYLEDLKIIFSLILLPRNSYKIFQFAALALESLFKSIFI